jgi:Xaa-Pro aminopeptidase
MQPCVTIGSYTWAQDRLPADEFSLRLDELRRAMARHGWRAVLAYGDVREHAALAYLSNFIPRVRWGMALLPRDGDARLLCAMSTRDLPAMRTLTWIADVRSGMGPEWDKAFDPWFERFHGDPAQFGTLGFDLMAPVLHDAVRRSLGERFVLRRADDVVAVPPQRKRPRELTLLRACCKLVQDAAQVFADSWRQKSGEPETAALDAERFARSRAAQDVRTLISLDGGRTLVPFQGRFEKTAGPLVGYLAVKLMGYWSDLFVTVDEGEPSPARRRVETELDALIATMRPGLRAGELHAEAIAALAPWPLHPALSHSVGHGIGLSLNEAPELRAGADATLVEDGVYTVQLGAADGQAGNVLLSAIVRTRANGAEVLARSPGIAAP